VDINDFDLLWPGFRPDKAEPELGCPHCSLEDHGFLFRRGAQIEPGAFGAAIGACYVPTGRTR
jgi:hypothetical protein